MRIQLALLSAALFCPAFAQEARGPGFGPGGLSPVFRALDADADGVISAAEMKNAPAALRTLDQNHDGQLTADELRPAFGGGRGGRGRGEGPGGGREATGPTTAELQETFMSFDRNKDGKLAKEELPERMQGMFTRGDTNKDGFLTTDEIAKLAVSSTMAPQAEGEGRGRGGPGFMAGDPLVAALDTDHDGVIPAAEIDNAPVALRAADKNADGQLTQDEVRPAFGRRGRGPQ